MTKLNEHEQVLRDLDQARRLIDGVSKYAVKFRDAATSMDASYTLGMVTTQQAVTASAVRNLATLVAAHQVNIFKSEKTGG